MHSKIHAHEALGHLFSTTSNISDGVPLFLVPAVARDPPPTPLHDPLTTTHELLKKFIFTTENRHRAWADGDWTDIVKVAANKMSDLRRYR